MKERPILFSGEMVRAILDGRKTQTRRVMKPQPTARVFQYCSFNAFYPALPDAEQQPNYNEEHVSPYGIKDDRLWVRETWGYWGSIKTKEWVIYRADGGKAGMKWRPSIFMPRDFSRITLEVVKVRVERVQDISNEDAKAEGVAAWHDSVWTDGPYYRGEFELLWDSINDKRGFGWNVNPWVWVIEFKRIK